MATNVFQLSALSQNDLGAADGDKLQIEITAIHNGTLAAGSFPINKEVPLPIPPGEANPAPATPTWFLVPNGEGTPSFDVVISSASDPSYPTTKITVTEDTVIGWVTEPFNDRVNQIYSKGENGIIGFAQKGPNGYIYTLTAGILNPRLHGNPVSA
ncbi:hypothetical protein [Tenacibaculum sp. M341]|uniref:hypothetical protein n=1 Tax=Tenacibaculum sp. M341 TaxID=2530339 RepID=UPI00104F0F5A|nr:hypothetical protein [Tenacibaculum sp. M341]TCI91319.1 hypothetical protein EYW44_10205 [Tenacibaculum sp. M341]